jgi:predicted Zn-dependent protease
MVNAVDLSKAREAMRKTQRQITSVHNRLDTSCAPVSFAAGQARLALREAESAVKKLRALLTASRGGRVDFALVSQIRAAEKRVEQARETLSRIGRDNSLK